MARSLFLSLSLSLSPIPARLPAVLIRIRLIRKRAITRITGRARPSARCRGQSIPRAISSHAIFPTGVRERTERERGFRYRRARCLIIRMAHRAAMAWRSTCSAKAAPEGSLARKAALVGAYGYGSLLLVARTILFIAVKRKRGRGHPLVPRNCYVLISFATRVHRFPRRLLPFPSSPYAVYTSHRHFHRPMYDTYVYNT